MVNFKIVFVVIGLLLCLSGWANESNSVDTATGIDTSVLVNEDVEVVPLDESQATEKEEQTFFNVPVVLPEHLGPVLTPKKQTHSVKNTSSQPSDLSTNPHPQILPIAPMFDVVKPWSPTIVPFLDAPIGHLPESDTKPLPVLKVESEEKLPNKAVVPATIQAVDVHPKMPRIAILIDDLGYNRQGMTSSLALPSEVALAILPETPFARATALTAKEQKRITLLHAPMENQRELKLGPGGLYAKMTEQELKATLNKDLDGLPGIQGVNNHMGSLLTTKEDSMKWVMETLKGRSLFFIDSLTSPKSVARKTAQEYGLKTVSRDVFLDNIRTEQAIDKQFSRLIKLAKRHGSALAIGHPYPETMAYLKKRLHHLERDGVRLVHLSDVLVVRQKNIQSK
ncbi:divergent polysaccharide deacetylase family protein [Marinomonas profundimaris]|uniref:divergent polysaccharide deacetylase family protein n=1 Tax=Marinomonas profundimaris TaxID=1208321 RepID=UPI0009FE3CDC|nr:divergent polysaccharide deacetylase family protein [Marinomonas profundimaris]